MVQETGDGVSDRDECSSSVIHAGQTCFGNKKAFSETTYFTACCIIESNNAEGSAKKSVPSPSMATFFYLKYNLILTISEEVATRRGGPHVPAPDET